MVKTETVQEYLARGGVIRLIPAVGAAVNHFPNGGSHDKSLRWSTLRNAWMPGPPDDRDEYEQEMDAALEPDPAFVACFDSYETLESED